MSDTMSLADAVLNFEELCKAEIPERKMILAWLPQGGLTMIYAPRGLGKTFFGLSLAVACASGGRFLKWDVQAPCGVLYLDGEMRLQEYRERLVQFVKGELKHPLHTLSHESFYHVFERDLSITNADIQAAMLDLLDGNPAIKLVVIDNLSVLAHLPEDKGDYWRAEFLPFLIALRRRGVAVLLIHHAGKSGDQRGASAREDALDAVIKLSKADDEKGDGAKFKVEFTKSRGAFGVDVEPFIATLKTVGGFFEWEITAIDQSVEKRLLALIEAVDGLTVMEASRELHVSHSQVSKAKKKLVGGRANPHGWEGHGNPMRDKPFLARSTFVPWNGIPFQKSLCGGHALFFGTEFIKPAYSLGKIRSKGGTESQSVPMLERNPFHIRSLRRSGHEV